MADEHVALRRCGTDQPGTGDRRRIADFEAGYLEAVQESQLDVEIGVSFIHITSTSGDGAVSADQRAEQISELNQAYGPLGIRFSYREEETTIVANDQFFKMGHKSAAERQCKSQHQAVDPRRGLNLYTAEPGGGILGWATFPYELAGDPTMDGVVLLHSTFPGGANSPYNLGKTAIHELGHWLGLYHTFQDGCFGEGDEVSDTPAHSGPNYGKPADSGQPHNLCPTAPAGVDCPIHNYMNYVDDDWMTEFTPGQRTRIFAQLGLFRTDLLGGTQIEAAAEGAGRAQW